MYVITNMKICALIKSVLLVALLAVVGGANATALQQELNEAGVKVRLSVSTNEFSLAGVPIFMELELNPSPGYSVAPPEDITPYLDGFELESYFSEEISADGLAHCYHYKLIPQVGPEYSATKRYIYPIAISVLDVATTNQSFILLEQLTFNAEKLSGEAAVTNSIEPVHIDYNHWITVKYACYGLLIIFIGGLLYLVIKFIRHKHKLKMMTPRERALHELDLLVSKNLVDKGLVKDFYVELTHVVRRYIERKYGIKAPERTTEEFIAEAIALDVFPKQYIPMLKSFLAFADMVKFAQYESTKANAFNAIDAAKNYINVDSLTEQKPNEEGK